jgi:DNA-binding MltR family transcriptional regulator
VDLEAQEDVLRATFSGIRDSVRELLGVRADALVRKFHETHDMAVKDEIDRLLKEHGKLKDHGCLGHRQIHLLQP